MNCYLHAVNISGCMGCHLSKKEDENQNDQKTNTEKITNQTMASNAKHAADYKSRLEWKFCLVFL